MFWVDFFFGPIPDIANSLGVDYGVPIAETIESDGTPGLWGDLEDLVAGCLQPLRLLHGQPSRLLLAAVSPTASPERRLTGARW